MIQKDDTLRKVDLHVHTPESVCYSEQGVGLIDIVEAALAQGIEILAITDHNSVDAIPEVRKVADGRLYILPGVELTTQSGHFLALFDFDTSIEDLEKFLDYVKIDRLGRGDAHTVADDDTLDTIRKIQESGGVAIAAHIDRWPSGFMESKQSRKYKRSLHESEYLDGLEITIPENKPTWNGGEVRGYPKHRACTQGSDAHKPEEVGRRPVFIRMETPGLPALREALQEFSTHIFFPDEVTE